MGHRTGDSNELASTVGNSKRDIVDENLVICRGMRRWSYSCSASRPLRIPKHLGLFTLRSLLLLEFSCFLHSSSPGLFFFVVDSGIDQLLMAIDLCYPAVWRGCGTRRDIIITRRARRGGRVLRVSGSTIIQDQCTVTMRRQMATTSASIVLIGCPSWVRRCMASNMLGLVRRGRLALVAIDLACV